MGLMNGMKLGLAINSKLGKASKIGKTSGRYTYINKDTIIQTFLESVEGKGQFTVVEWSILGKQLEIFGGNGKE